MSQKRADFERVCHLSWSIHSKNKSTKLEHRKSASKSGKNAIRNAKKYAIVRTEVFRLIGLYYWLIGRQNKAANWWKITIEEGKRLGAQPDLART